MRAPIPTSESSPQSTWTPNRGVTCAFPRPGVRTKPRPASNTHNMIVDLLITPLWLDPWLRVVANYRQGVYSLQSKALQCSPSRLSRGISRLLTVDGRLATVDS